MRAVFLADAHLKNHLDEGYKKCMHFFDGLHVNNIDLLVIAGDFFDFWFERKGRIYSEFEPVVKNIVRLKSEGVRICICEGNHDFFLNDYFGKKLGMEVYPDEIELLLDDLTVYVAHGDRVDEDNRRYLALRGFLRSTFVYTIQKFIPLGFLFFIARLSSGMSREMTASTQNRIVDKMVVFAEKKYDEGINAVILGHSHAELLRETSKNGHRQIFSVLGDWITSFTFLEYENGVFSFKRFKE